MVDMFPLVIRPRIAVPRRRDELLTRQRLLDELLRLLGNRLVIISAPAGYGKTSLLVDFVHHLEWPVCWYAIDDLDADPLRFIAHFVSALQVRFPQFGRAALGILRSSSQDRLNLDMLVAAVVNEVYEHISEHFVFVLDDYHLVDSSRPINQFVSRFLQAVTENCHLFVASRTLLTLPDLALLVARSEVGGVGVDELCFQPDEIQALFLQNQRQVLPTNLARELARKTEGWITGVLLSGQSPGGALPASRGTLKATGLSLDGYLAQQVLEKQPEEIQIFLLRTALLEEFNAGFCAEVIGPALNLDLNWVALMESAMRNNLFILPVGEESIWLRYHHLFLEFLQNRMLQQRPEESKSIQARLAAVYAGRGEWERAYRVYQRLGQLANQANLLEQAGPELMSTGRLNTLAEWLSTLPDELRLARPVLLSLQGGVAIMRGELPQARALLDQAIAGLRQGGDPYQLSTALARRVVGLRLLGQYPLALADAEEALAVLAGLGPSRVLAEAMRARGTVLITMGEVREAFEQLSQAYALFQTLGDTTSAARLLMEMGITRRQLGQLDEAEAAYTQALALWEADGNLAWQANLLNNLGVLQHERGEYLAAAHSLERAIECARLAGYLRMEVFALAGLGDLYRDLEAFNEAAEAYRQAIIVVGRLEERYLLFYLDLARGILARRQKQYTTAREMLSSAMARVDAGLSPAERAQCVLQQASLDLLQGQFESVMPALTEITAFFASRKLRVEVACCQFLAMLAASGQGDSPSAQKYAQQFMETWDSPKAWPPLVSVAREFVHLLEPAQAVLEPLARRLLRQTAQLDQRLPGLRRQLRPQAGVVPLGPAQVQIVALGKVEVLVNHAPVSSADWRTPAARELLFLLLARPQGLSKEQIGLIFWPDASPIQLWQRFRTLVYRLRRAVGREVVLFGPDEIYAFNTGLDYEYDVEAFERKLDLIQRDHDPALKLRHLQQATRLYQGPYLPEMDTEWVLSERERLRLRCLDALVQAATLALDLKRPEQTLQICRQAFTVDPGSEESHRLAMRSYAANGDRAGLIRQYQLCRQALQDEYGAELSPQTKRLYEELTREN
jgi:ATP/maltotriose-dependent transcriptional regulator MalT/DNA-binding SARP family transcriptional activator